MQSIFAFCFWFLILPYFAISQFLPPQPPRPPPRQQDKTYNGSYILVGPQILRKGMSYDLSVSVLKPISTMEITISDLSANRSIASRILRNLRAGQNVPVSLQTTGIASGGNGFGFSGYNLRAVGRNHFGQVVFDQEDFLRADSHSESVFIQTDKGMYKPGNLVRYRIVVVTPEMKPSSGTVSIKIKDKKRNVISQHLDQRLNRGVFSNEMQLSDEPPLGEWTIQVQTSAGSQMSKSFTVEEYVLPKFEVEVETVPQEQALTSSSIKAKVKAMYTFGKGLQGTATIRAALPYYFFPIPFESGVGIRGPPGPRFPRPPRPDVPRGLEKIVQLDQNGEAEVVFTNAELRSRKLIRDYGNQLNISALVTEELTGEQRGDSQMIQLVKNPVNFVFHKPSQYFKPSMEYSLKMSVVTYDDKPLHGNYPRRVNMNITYNFYRDPPPPSVGAVKDKYGNYRLHEYRSITLGRDGSADIELNPPENCSDVNIQAEYYYAESADSKINGYESVSSAQSPTDTYLSIGTIDTSVYSVGQNAHISVQATEPLGSVTVLVLSKGKIIAKIDDYPIPGKSGIIQLRITAEMAPLARIVVYKMRAENKEIIADVTQLKVEGSLRNQVRVSVNPAKARPGDRVQIRVQSDPNSFVGILGVDKSVKLLKSGNDITQKMVEREIQSYNNPGHYFGPMIEFRRKKRSVIPPFWGGGPYAKSVFQSAGVVVLTDGLLYSGDFGFCRGCRGPFTVDAVGAAAGGPLPAAPPPAALPGPSVPTEASFGGVPGGAPTRVRSVFPETWIWLDEVSRSDGETVYVTKAPDTITTWLTSAFAINDNTGLGVSQQPAEMEVFQPFFIRANLPYSVKRGEKLGLQVIVFNYQSAPRQVTVTLDHNANSGFDFVGKNGQTIKAGSRTPGYNRRQVTVGGRGGESADVFFPIIPTVIGNAKLTLRASSGRSRDILERNLLVEPEGYMVEINKPVTIDLNSNPTFRQTILMDVPEDIVPGSERAEVSAIGSVMGPAVQNVQSLVRMPYGCGEQNMVNFVPNIVVMRYLAAVRQLTPSVEQRAKRFMESGYQRELNYKRDDGSYSAFGDSDPAGSTWLTAFVMKSFAQAKPYIFIDDKVLKSGMAFLKKQQNREGSFEESGSVHHHQLQGGSGKAGVPLTAFVLTAMLHNQEKNEAAQEYLERSLDSIKDEPYALALTTYALHLAESPMRQSAFQMLDRLASHEKGTKYWKDRTSEQEFRDDKPSYWYQPASADVEMTGYALLTHMLRQDMQNAMPIVQWLTQQRNPIGGFTSTQDTVIALQGLGFFAERAYSNGLSASVQFRSGNDNHVFNIDPRNAVVLQQAKITDAKLPVSLDANGRGMVSTQVSLRYNTRRKRRDEPFDCSPQVTPKSSNDITVSMCCRYKQGGKTKMAVMEMNALSGYNIDRDQVHGLAAIPDLQRVELDKGNSKANIYFNSIGPSPTCFNVSSSKAFDVASQKPAQISLYAYYSPEKRVEMEYSVQRSQPLHVSCPRCWDNAVGRQVGRDTGQVSQNRNANGGWVWQGNKWVWRGRPRNNGRARQRQWVRQGNAWVRRQNRAKRRNSLRHS